MSSDGVRMVGFMLRSSSPGCLAAKLATRDRDGGLSGLFVGWRRARFYRRLAQVDLGAFLAAVDQDITDPSVSAKISTAIPSPSRTILGTHSRAAV